MRGVYRLPARIRPAIAAGALTLLLAGCAEQPIGNFERAQFVAEGAEAHHDVRFMPGCTRLAPGEAERLSAFLGELGLRRGDDVIVSMRGTGSDRRDRERRASLRSAIDAGPARVELSAATGFSREDPGKNTALVQVFRHEGVGVDCKDGGYSESDLAHRMPFPTFNCANPTNLAQMAAEKRDLTRPRALGPARGEPAAGAIRRQRDGEVVFIPLATNGGD